MKLFVVSCVEHVGVSRYQVVPVPSIEKYPSKINCRALRGPNLNIFAQPGQESLEDFELVTVHVNIKQRIISRQPVLRQWNPLPPPTM